MQKVRKFLTHTRWQEQKDPEGRAGITWIELYAWYNLHAAKEERQKGTEILKAKPSLQKELAAFKSITRKMATQCIDECDEWILQPCPSQENRLRKLAVANKHASIKGLPAVGIDDASQIAATILKLRVFLKKSQKELHQKGLLKLRGKN